jgi:transposase
LYATPKKLLRWIAHWVRVVWSSPPNRERNRGRDARPKARQAVYGNRRRIGGERGKELLRRRGELLERSFAHAYETGGMRRVYLRGRENVWKRLPIHLGGFNLSLVMRQLLGKGTPRGWQGLSAEAVLGCLRFWMALLARFGQELASEAVPLPADPLHSRDFHSARRRVNTSLLPRAVIQLRQE